MAVFTEDFSATPSDIDNADWDPATGGDLNGAALRTVSARFETRPVNQTAWGCVYTGSIGNDQYAECAVTQVDHSSDARVGVLCRWTSGGNYYCAYLTTTTLHLVKYVSGSLTSLDTFSHTWVSGDIVRMECSGTSIKAFINGAERISVTDSSLSSGQIGIYARRRFANNNGDDFEGGDLSAGGVTGTGAVTAGATTVSGSGSREVKGSGAVSTPATTVSGAGKREIKGSGAITVAAVAVSGAGKRGIPGSGGITAGPVTVSGSGAVGAGGVTGSGAIVLAAAVVSGSAARGVKGSGAINLAAATVSGADAAEAPPQPGGFIRPVIYVDAAGRPVGLRKAVEKAIGQAPRAERPDVRAAVRRVQAAIDEGALAGAMYADLVRLARILAGVDAVLAAAMREAAQRADDDDVATILLLAS